MARSTERVTSGILIWSKPFLCQDEFGKRFAVLLMDTQGIFDRESTMKDCASIFALSSLISTVQIYNIMQQLQEDDLKNLKVNFQGFVMFKINCFNTSILISVSIISFLFCTMFFFGLLM